MAKKVGAKPEQPVIVKTSSGTAKFGLIAIGLILGAVLGVAGVLLFQEYNPPDEPQEANILEASVVFERIQSENELVCNSQRYNITEKAGDSNILPIIDLPIPFTENSFWYRYVGEIKVAVSLETASFEQNDKTITISLDSPYISSNTPDRNSSGVLEENNNLLNPIHIEDIDAFLNQCIQKSEEEAVANGILDEAKSFAERDIKGMFNAALGDEYTIEIQWRS